MSSTDISLQLLPSVVSVLELSPFLLTSWELLDLELVFYWLLQLSTSTLKYSSRSRAKWAQWELYSSKQINSYNHHFFKILLYTQLHRRHLGLNLAHLLRSLICDAAFTQESTSVANQRGCLLWN